jgi:hypothetical protein
VGNAHPTPTVLDFSPAASKKTAGLIEKETLKKRISNNECRMSKGGIASLSLF